MTPSPPLRQTIPALALIAGLLAGACRADAAPAGLEHQFHDSVQPFLQTYCFGCHGKEKHKGDLDLSSFSTSESVIADFQKWDIVLEKLKAEEMPPDEAKQQPKAGERKAVIDWIGAVRKSAMQRNAGDPGVVLARRLSNAEYNYSIRDLTGVDIQPTREFPVDPANEAGFDNSGESLAMSPALVKKYLEAARRVSEYLVLKPEGFAFAPHPAVTDTDRDKYAVKRIVQFYQRQPVDFADYFRTAWQYQNRAALGKRRATLDDFAAEQKISPKYLATVWATLNGPQETTGPVAALQAMWRELPGPTGRQEPDGIRPACEKMRDFVKRVRDKVKPEFPNLMARPMHEGSQSLVLWKDRQYATHRLSYGGGALELKLREPAPESAAGRAMTVPDDQAGQERYEAAFQRFCAIFPDAFFVSERARVYLDPKKEAANAAGRLLSAGFHSQMGYFRDDAPLYQLVLSAEEQKELDMLWRELDFITFAPMRQHRNFLWFERTDSRFMMGSEFDFARSEDKDSTSEAKIKRLSEVYLAKVRKNTTNELILQVVKDHFERVNANIRAVEKDRLAAEPSHLAALQTFAERAYRRPLLPKEREDILAFYHTLRNDDGLEHEDAMRDSVVSILMSPYFCYRVDLPAPGSGVRPLSDYALASRLSYFLWASLPDKQLLDHAAAGDLHRPKILLAETRRMLQDNRIAALTTEFGGNWMAFRRFEEHNAVDRERFPAFNNELREAMFEEPIRFFDDVVRSNRSVLDFLYGNYTFVNPVLAKHYGMPEPNVRSNEWVRVDDANKYERGGLLPMSVFLAMNAPGLRTSPVKRGYWVVRRLLGEVIPPPPPNVPTLPADEAKMGELTLRESLARHREDKNCATCHARFDAIGLAFEGYGPVGELRTKDFGGHPVDTRAQFPGGSEGTGLAGLRTYLHDNRQEDFLDNLCRKLLSYGLGRGLLLSDELTIQEMHAKLAANGYRFNSLIENIVTSPQFLNQRTLGDLSRN